ncbi:hypothetical protein ACJMK2_011234, partial [Sinanodonta woodiana]
ITPIPLTEDIPVHSTPIKGTKVPLPSTKSFTRTSQHSNANQSHNLSDRTMSQMDKRSPRSQSTSKMGSSQLVSKEAQRTPDKCIIQQGEQKAQKKPRDIARSGEQRATSSAHYSRPLSSRGKESPVSSRSLAVRLGTAELLQNRASAFTPPRGKSNENGRNLNQQLMRQGSPGQREVINCDSGQMTGSGGQPNNYAYSNVSPSSVENLSRRRSSSPCVDEQRLFSSHRHSADLESMTIQRQRKEIQFLVTELKDRDRELNDIMESHQQQLLAWEQDRHRLMQLEQTCSQYKEELEVKAHHMKQLAEQVKQLKTSQTSHTQALESTQEKVMNLSKANSLQSQKIQELEEENQALNASLKDACTTVGRLQAREEELSTLQKLKEKDIVSATNQMRELSDRLTQLDRLCRESQSREKEAIKHAEHWKQNFLDEQKKVDQMTSELEQSAYQSKLQMEEIVAVRHRITVIEKECSERMKCKDDLVTSLKAKQERTDAQIKTLRELYERQQKEITVLQQSLNTSEEIIQRQQTSLEASEQNASRASHGSYGKSTSHSVSEHSYQQTGSPTSLRTMKSPKTSVSGPVQWKDSEIDYMNLQQQTQTSGYQSAIIDPHSQTSDNSGAIADESVFARQPMFFNPDHANKVVTFSRNPTGDQSYGHRFSGDKNKISPQPHVLDTQAIHNWDSIEAQTFSPRFQTNSPKSSEFHSDHLKNGINRELAGSYEQHKSQEFREEIMQESKQTSPKNHSGFHTPPLAGVRDEEYVMSKERGTGSGALSESQMGHRARKGDDEFRINFEDRLSSFLEDAQEIDDSIWDKPCSRPVNEVEASPSSKLQKLLIESRMMINHLEKTSSLQSPPRDQIDTNSSAIEEKQKEKETHSSGSVGITEGK